MPIENITSSLIRPRNTEAPSPDSILLSGILRATTGEIANAADAAGGSKYRLCHLPSHCMIDPGTFFVVDQWGFGGIRIGTEDTPAALLTAAKSAAAVARPVVAGDARYDKRLWEILGMPKDPGGDIYLYAHGEIAATGAGVLRFRIVYILD